MSKNKSNKQLKFKWEINLVLTDVAQSIEKNYHVTGSYIYKFINVNIYDFLKFLFEFYFIFIIFSKIVNILSCFMFCCC